MTSGRRGHKIDREIQVGEALAICYECMHASMQSQGRKILGMAHGSPTLRPCMHTAGSGACFACMHITAGRRACCAYMHTCGDWQALICMHACMRRLKRPGVHACAYTQWLKGYAVLACAHLQRLAGPALHACTYAAVKTACCSCLCIHAD
jgi:hypothetical protein